MALIPSVIWHTVVAVHKRGTNSPPALSEEMFLKRKQAGLSKQAFSSCVMWLPQVIVVTDFKRRHDSVWQPGDSSFLLLAELQAITAASHAEPTECQPYFCLRHHLMEHQKAIRARQGWHLAFFFRQVHARACVEGYFKNEFALLYLGETFHRGDQKRAVACGFVLQLPWPDMAEGAVTRRLVCTSVPLFVA